MDKPCTSCRFAVPGTHDCGHPVSCYDVNTVTRELFLHTQLWMREAEAPCEDGKLWEEKRDG